MNKRIKILVSIGVIVVIATLFYFVSQAITKSTGYTVGDNRINEFASCLTEKGSIIYVYSVDCEACNKQKSLFGDSWKYLNVINCETNENSGEAGCLVIKVTQQPTWFLNNRMRSGEKSLELLSNITGCVL